MGRNRLRTKILTSPSAQHTSSATPTKTPSIPSLIEKAKELIVQCDYELALRFVRRILEQQPDNVEVREMLGVCLLETGEIEAAKEVGNVLFDQ